ncbi:MAG: hypothetical protein K8F27_03660 [Sulfuricellaceae bacterium]|nr:hypothetical protein [Sulfuricellaceae bacterium]
MTASAKKLLAVIEFFPHSRLPAFYQTLGFEVMAEWQVRKAISLVRKNKPDIIAADFYSQTDFRDRLSNLESLLATLQPLPDIRVLVFYEPKDEAVLAKVRERLRIDAALPTPVSDEAIKAVLSSWQ